MKALTLHQPWASLIAAGLKKYETRSRPLKYRGEIAIHAGKKFTSVDTLALVRTMVPFSKKAMVPVHFPTGMVILVAEMTDCIEMTEELIAEIAKDDPVELYLGDWKPGRYAYKLENIRPLTNPFEINGQQGIWNIDDNLITGNY